jgi:hypothetical protein
MTNSGRWFAAAALIGLLTACGGGSTTADPTQDAVSTPTAQAPDQIDPMLANKTECLAVANEYIELLGDTQTYAQETAVGSIETYDAAAIDAAADLGEGIKSEWDALTLKATACDPISPSFSQAVSEYSNAADDMVTALHMTADGIRTSSVDTLNSALALLEEALGHMQTGSSLIDTATAEVQAY